MRTFRKLTQKHNIMNAENVSTKELKQADASLRMTKQENAEAYLEDILSSTQIKQHPNHPSSLFFFWKNKVIMEHKYLINGSAEQQEQTPEDIFAHPNLTVHRDFIEQPLLQDYLLSENEAARTIKQLVEQRFHFDIHDILLNMYPQSISEPKHWAEVSEFIKNYQPRYESIISN